MQARGFLNYRSKYCWPKVIYHICLGLSDGRYFTGLAGIVMVTTSSGSKNSFQQLRKYKMQTFQFFGITCLGEGYI